MRKVTPCHISHYCEHLRYAINPARDLGPRVMTWMFGWGSQVWTSSGYWFWIPVVCCHLGGLLGAGLYLVTMDWDWVEQEETEGGRESEELRLKVDKV